MKFIDVCSYNTCDIWKIYNDKYMYMFAVLDSPNDRLTLNAIQIKLYLSELGTKMYDF